MMIEGSTAAYATYLEECIAAWKPGTDPTCADCLEARVSGDPAEPAAARASSRPIGTRACGARRVAARKEAKKQKRCRSRESTKPGRGVGEAMRRRWFGIGFLVGAVAGLVGLFAAIIVDEELAARKGGGDT